MLRLGQLWEGRLLYGAQFSQQGTCVHSSLYLSSRARFSYWRARSPSVN